MLSPPISSANFVVWFKSLPECGATCLVEAIQTQSNCVLTDPACSCASQAVQAAAESCVLGSCTIPDALATQNLTNSLCGVSSDDNERKFPVLYTFVVFSSIIVALRFIVRFTKPIPMWWDDYAALLSALISVGFTVICGVSGELGLGLDLWAVQQENISTILILGWAGQLCYIGSRFFIRVSIILFMMRIFRSSSARQVLIYMLALNAAIAVTYLFSVIFQCIPLSYFWEAWDGLHDGHCSNQWAIFFSAGIITTILDFALILLPVRWISQVHFSRSNKITSLCMFSLGVVVIILSIFRIISIYKFTHSNDITHYLANVAFWGGLELYVANICACLPSLRPLLRPRFSDFRAWVTGAPKHSDATSQGVSDSHTQSSSRKRLANDDGFDRSHFEENPATYNDLPRV
ncbi:hypothetical protein F4680DRAFT_422977 [Xylaria scruposa]|nr:hypothetical protein F4680DRAFT_422977 [Xylaria scruposa]